MNNNFKAFAAAAALALSATANAGIYEGYRMDASSVENSNWKANRGSLSVAEGGVLQFAEGQNNSSSIFNMWGANAWAGPDAENNGTDNYYVAFDFKIQTGNDVTKNAVDTITGITTYKQQGYQMFLTSMPDESAAWKTNWWTGGNDWLFNLSEVTNADINTAPKETPVFQVCGTETNVTIDVTKFYTFSALLDKNAHTVKYTIVETEAGTTLTEGTYTVADTLSMLPTGLFVGANRYQAGFACKNLVIGKYVDGVALNAPAYRLAEVANENRGYVFTCAEGCEIHVAGQGLADMDGNPADEIVITYDKVESQENLVYVTSTGTIKAWTEADGGKSREVEIEVECGMVKLPTPVATIVGVSEGFSKTYQVTIDNSDVPTKPNMKFSYTYGDIAETDLPSGSKISLEGAGVLKIKAVLFGFEDSETVTIVNNQYYVVSTELDFEHTSAEDIIAKGFEKAETLAHDGTMSGRTNFTGRSDAMYDFLVVGEDTTKIYMPTGVEAIAERYYDIYHLKEHREYRTLDSITAYTLFAPMYFVNYGENAIQKEYKGEMTYQTMEWYQGVGIANETNSCGAASYGFYGMKDGEFAIVYQITGYGRNVGSTHGYFASVEEAQASCHATKISVLGANETFTNASPTDIICKVQVLSEDESKRADVSDTPETPENAIKPIVKVRNISGIFGIDGRKINSTRRGLNIVNGKMIVVK